MLNKVSVYTVLKTSTYSKNRTRILCLHVIKTNFLTKEISEISLKRYPGIYLIQKNIIQPGRS